MSDAILGPGDIVIKKKRASVLSLSSSQGNKEWEMIWKKKSRYSHGAITWYAGRVSHVQINRDKEEIFL